jgi:tRNA pseudouridine55 synthase
MARKRKGDKVDGWINLDKPAGLTSTQAVGKVRRIFNAQKVGHAGTLDPLATGILPIALGEATKTIPYVQDALKTYLFTVSWGEQRDTDDGEGDVIASSDVRPVQTAIEAALPRYIGDIQQIPPKFSAIKIDGQRAYDLARGGEDVELQPRTVTIESLKLLKLNPETADFEMICGKGTYVRSLARDLALDLGTYGYVSALRRTAVGGFDLNTSISLDLLEKMGDSAALNEVLMPLDSALDDILALNIRQDEAAKLRNGQVVSLISKPDFERLKQAGFGDKDVIFSALARCGEKPVALVEIEGPHIRPVRVLNI